MMSDKTIIDIVSKLNDNCNHNDKNFFDKFVWEKNDFNESNHSSKGYCSRLYPMGKNVDITNWHYVLCDNCAEILSNYKNDQMIQSNTTDTMMKSVLNRLDELERTMQKVNDHMRLRIDKQVSCTKSDN